MATAMAVAVDRAMGMGMTMAMARAPPLEAHALVGRGEGVELGAIVVDEHLERVAREVLLVLREQRRLELELVVVVAVRAAGARFGGRE
eukprot:6818092-Prymnesium_polylepis.1